MQVVYMVKPMNFASLKFSGTFRVLMAYTVHTVINTMLYTWKNKQFKKGVMAYTVHTVINTMLYTWKKKQFKKGVMAYTVHTVINTMLYTWKKPVLKGELPQFYFDGVHRPHGNQHHGVRLKKKFLKG